MKITQIISSVMLLAIASAAHAVPVGTYQFFDHPDSALTATYGPYGLRMDDLMPPTGNGPVFSVNANGAAVFLTWNGGSTATITGNIWNNQTGGLWAVTQTISGIAVQANGWTTNDVANSDLTLDDPANGVGVDYTYAAKTKGSGESFLFLSDSHRCSGYAGCGPIVARGWFNPQTGDGGTNDWLVQARHIPTPAPGILMLLATGLIGIGAARKFIK